MASRTRSVRRHAHEHDHGQRRHDDPENQQTSKEMKMTRSKTLRNLAAAVVAVAIFTAAKATKATEQQKQSRGVTNIVLVHGAWADGSSWSKVIPLLAAKGLHIDAVQLPLT